MANIFYRLWINKTIFLKVQVFKHSDQNKKRKQNLNIQPSSRCLIKHRDPNFHSVFSWVDQSPLLLLNLVRHTLNGFESLGITTESNAVSSRRKTSGRLKASKNPVCNITFFCKQAEREPLLIRDISLMMCIQEGAYKSSFGQNASREVRIKGYIYLV